MHDMSSYSRNSILFFFATGFIEFVVDCLQLRIAALNESDSGEEESDQEDEPTATKEAEVL